jgi:hypothetical protein
MTDSSFHHSSDIKVKVSSEIAVNEFSPKKKPFVDRQKQEKKVTFYGFM